MDESRSELSVFRSAVDTTVPGQRASVLADLLFYIGQAARGAYVEAGTSSTAAANHLRGFNEMTLVVASELQMLLTDTRSGRSADDLFSALTHWAQVGNCQAGLQWALGKALQGR